MLDQPPATLLTAVRHQRSSTSTTSTTRAGSTASLACWQKTAPTTLMVERCSRHFGPSQIASFRHQPSNCCGSRKSVLHRFPVFSSTPCPTGRHSTKNDLHHFVCGKSHLLPHEMWVAHLARPAHSRFPIYRRS